MVGKPGPGKARIRHTAVGLNFVDIYNRSGLYPLPLPSGLGGEAAGVVEEVGSGVTDLKPGDRICYGAAPIGSYAEARLIPADRLLKLPDGIDDKTAAAMMLKGLTTQYLIRQTYRVKAGDTILLHAAAGGVGLILSQWAKPSAPRDRHRRQRRKGKARARPMVAPTRSSIPARILSNASRRSPAARGCRWSTTPSARTRS